MTTATTAATGTDEGYATLERQIAERVEAHRGPLFTTKTDPKELWGTFLHSLPEETRQHYNCRNCAFFVERFGGLVRISEKTGQPLPLLWWDPTTAPAFFKTAVYKLYELVVGAGIDGVFYSSDATWGVPKNDGKEGRVWTHLHGVPAVAQVFRAPLLTAGQAMAVKREEYGMLVRALEEFPAELVAEGLRVLRSATLARPEKAIAIAEWFAAVHEAAGKRPRADSRIWLAVASAPSGFAHVRSTILATLLDDVKNGSPFAKIKASWDEKLDPLQYQRPQAPPKEGALDVAEKLVAKLGVERSLERRSARLTDVPANARLWSPPADEPETGGTFGHLRKAKKAPLTRVALPPQKISWTKFRREVLASAQRLEVALEDRGPFFGLTAPTHADAPNMFQWDNAIGWYFHGDAHKRGGLRSDWNLGSQRWGEVALVTLGPPQWSDESANVHHQNKALFFVAGQRDRSRETGLALFPEFLRSEFREIRSVLEAHSGAKQLSAVEESDACGVAFQAQGTPTVTVRVDGHDLYVLDRWD